jgi:hypothetical protein
LPDKKFALQLRAQQIAIAKDAIMQARVSDGDEGWNTVDHTPDWIAIRGRGGSRWGAGGLWGGYADGGGDGLGVLGYGWGSCSFADGSAY